MSTENPILLDLPMPIETPRLILRNVLPGDGAAMHEAKTETWNMLHQWMPWATEIGTAEESEVNIREAYADFILRQNIRVHGYERETGKLVVSSGLHRFNWSLRRFEIGYFVRKSAQGKGYATETAHALTRYAFGALDAKAVVIDVADGNEASMNIAKKLGFKLEGIEKNGIRLPAGNIVDRHVFSRTSMNDLPDLDVIWGAGL